MLLFCTKLQKVTLVKNGWPLKVNGEDHKKQDLYFEMLLFSEKGHKVTLMPFPVKLTIVTYKKEHITIFLHYNILWNNKPNCYISVIYSISCTLTLSNRDNIMEQQI